MLSELIIKRWQSFMLLSLSIIIGITGLTAHAKTKAVSMDSTSIEKIVNILLEEYESSLMGESNYEPTSLEKTINGLLEDYDFALQNNMESLSSDDVTQLLDSVPIAGDESTANVPVPSWVHALLDDGTTVGAEAISAAAVECGSVPTDGCYVTRNTTFIPGTYYLPNGITIAANEVVLDGNGSTLVGVKDGWHTGIYAHRQNMVTIKNLTITGYDFGMRLSVMWNLWLTDNTFCDNRYGIYNPFEWSYCHVINNTFLETLHDSIRLGLTHDLEFVNNTVINIYRGGNPRSMYFRGFNNTIANNYFEDYIAVEVYTPISWCTFRQNTINNSNYGFFCRGSSSPNFVSKNVFEDNIVENSWRGFSLGQEVLDNLFQNNVLNNNDVGFSFDFAVDNTIRRNDISNNIGGIFLSSSSRDNVIHENVICSNTDYDISNYGSNSGYKNKCDTALNWNDLGTTGCTYLCASRVVAIDIKPGSYPNPINLGANGLVPVAIFSDAEFDATQVDPVSVSLAGAGVAVRGKGKSMAHEEDVNGDGLADLIIQVETQSFGDLGDGGTLKLTGTTYDGENIVGYDDVVLVPLEM